MSPVLTTLDARFFALCRQHRITPPLDERGELTDATWLGAAPAEVLPPPAWARAS